MEEKSFLESALSKKNKFQSMEDFLKWFESRKSANKFEVEEIPLSKLDKWKFDDKSGDLVHDTGKFFKVRGIHVESNDGNWEQPIIDQPEIGILGIVTKVFDGVRYFLMQAKMEPGNIGLLQLSPTLQATKSNYTRVHKGKSPNYLEYFIGEKKGRVLVDHLQTEHGGRFLRKRNRNIIVDVEIDVDVIDDFKWLTLGELKYLMGKDNFVNMDARSVLSCINLIGENSYEGEMFDTISKKDGLDDIVHWFTEMKSMAELKLEVVGLKNISNWKISDDISNINGDYFKIIGVNVLAGNREINSWTQPLIKHKSFGVVGFLTKKIDGVIQFLVQAKMEPGSFSIVEMAPSVACCNAEDRLNKGNVKFLELFMNAKEENIIYSCFQSDEGGRYYKSQNKCMIIKADEGLEIPKNYKWMTLGQIMELIKHNYFNIDARGLISYLELK
jgi:dTDP-4-dehydro-6-deoxy-alpha-D-glucopyranose 2,3-dehydratase